MNNRFMKGWFGLIIVVMFVICPGCKTNSKDNRIDNQIEATIASTTLPKKLGDGSSYLTECYYLDRTLTYRIKTDKNTLAKMKVEDKSSATLEKMKSGLLTKHLVDMLSKVGASARYIYYNDGDSLCIVLSSVDLQNVE